jgi:hypothetical protein
MLMLHMLRPLMLMLPMLVARCGWLQDFEKKGGKGVPLGLGYALRCVLFGLVCLGVYTWALPIFSVDNFMGPYRHWNVLARCAAAASSSLLPAAACCLQQPAACSRAGEHGNAVQALRRAGAVAGTQAGAPAAAATPAGSPS